MAIFTRDAVLLKWNGDATERAFKVLKDGYQGGEDQKPASYERALFDGGLLRVFSSKTPRQFIAAIMAEDSATGTMDGVSYGTIAELKLAHAATDLKCKSFEDSDYWNAEWQGSWNPAVDFDPMRNYSTIPVMLVER